MVEPGTTIGAGLALLGMKDVLVKLLGPTADYLGEGLKSYTEKGSKNLQNIFQKGIEKLGKKIDEKGQVPPKVLKGILSEGYFCEDTLSAEYFGGVLASSRSGVSRDDRGATHINLISSLSTYQIRTHFVLYTIVRRLFVGSKLKPGLDMHRMQVYVPFDVYCSGMDFQTSEKPDLLFIQAITGLSRLELLSYLAYGSMKHLDESCKGIGFRKDGLIFSPTPTGMDLYLWAHGKGSLTYHHFLKQEVVLDSLGITIQSGAFSIDEEKRKQKEKKSYRDNKK